MRTKRTGWLIPSLTWNLVHPKEALLQAFEDRELSSRSYRRVASHLENCRDCASLLSQLRKDLKQYQELERSAFPSVSLHVAQGLMNLRESIQSASSGSRESILQAHEIRPEMHARVMSELEVYLGKGTMAGLADRLGRGQERFITEAETLISVFLGHRVADEVRLEISRLLNLDGGSLTGPA